MLKRILLTAGLGLWLGFLAGGGLSSLSEGLLPRAHSSQQQQPKEDDGSFDTDLHNAGGD